MKVLNAFPPNIDEIRKVVVINPGACFCYEHTLWNPFEIRIGPELYAHELVHERQQGEDSKGWWRRYLADKDFRLSQEIPAYQTQYQVFCSLFRDKNRQSAFANSLAGFLSGDSYGDIISRGEAYKAIRRKELFDFRT